MATSGSKNWDQQRDEIIKRAMRLIGATAAGEPPTANEITDCGVALNAMMKEWGSMGIGLWLNIDTTLHLALSTRSYSIGLTGDNVAYTSYQTALAVAAVGGAGSITVDSDTNISDADKIGIILDDGSIQWTTVNGAPIANVVTLTDVLTGPAAIDQWVYNYTTKAYRPIEIVDMRRILSDGTEVPMEEMGRNEYLGLTNKDSAGPPTQYYFDPQLVDAKLFLWPVTTDLKIRVNFTSKTYLDDADNITDNMQFPVEWINALTYNLAVDIEPEFPTDATRLAKVIKRADQAFNRATGFDRSTASVKMGPDLRRMR